MGKGQLAISMANKIDGLLNDFKKQNKTSVKNLCLATFADKSQPSN